MLQCVPERAGMQDVQDVQDVQDASGRAGMQDVQDDSGRAGMQAVQVCQDMTSSGVLSFRNSAASATVSSGSSGKRTPPRATSIC